MEPLRVAVIEEDEVLRRGLVALLLEDPFIEVVHDGPDGPPGEIDVAIVSSGKLPEIQTKAVVIVLFSDHDAPLDHSAAVRGHLVRESLTADQVVASVRAAAVGLRVRPDAVDVTREATDGRRVELLRLLAAGKDTRAIATTLRCSERTVKTLIHDINVEFGTRTRAQAVAEAIKRGLL